jgi:AraC-like DNA-binding protein
MASSDVETRQPHVALRRYVARYVGYRLEGYPAGVHRGLPTTLLTFIVQLDQPRAFVAGLRTSAVLLPHRGFHHGIAIELTVRGARALLAAPAGALTEQVAELSDLVGPEGRDLSERLATCAGWEPKFALLDRALLSLLKAKREPRAEIVRACELLTGHVDGASVEALAQAAGFSRRHFSEIFQREIGLPPRQLRRVVRFERSCALLRSPQRRTLSQIAADSGYFDHAHLLHEWRALADCRPDQWLVEELLSVQAEAHSAA